jgi:uncharacterized protein (DUF488 family)
MQPADIPRPDRSVAQGATTASVMYTIGHSTRSWQEFLQLLQTHGIQQLVDVRRFPGSRRHPQFSQETLNAACREAGIGYTHLPELGGLRKARADSENTGWRNASFRGYADYMQTAEFSAGLERLLKLAAGTRCAVMCAEAVPWRCHRSLLADALIVQGTDVQDIISGKETRPHVLTPFARVHGHSVTYPAADFADQQGSLPLADAKPARHKA